MLDKRARALRERRNFIQRQLGGSPHAKLLYFSRRELPLAPVAGQRGEIRTGLGGSPVHTVPRELAAARPRRVPIPPGFLPGRALRPEFSDPNGRAAGQNLPGATPTAGSAHCGRCPSRPPGAPPGCWAHQPLGPGEQSRPATGERRYASRLPCVEHAVGQGRVGYDYPHKIFKGVGGIEVERSGDAANVLQKPIQ